MTLRGHHRYVALAVTAFTLLALERTTHGKTPRQRQFASDRISVVTRGKGPDIILIPGLFSHRDVWARVSERLESRYRLHLVQVNGFAGFALGANADGPVAAPVAEDIVRYVRDVGLARPAVIGHSMGGSIGMMLAARHPNGVGRLMVVDAMPFTGAMFGQPGGTAASVRPVADQIRTRILAEPAGSPSGMIEQMAAGMTCTEAMRPVLLRYLRDSYRPTVANAFHELIVTDLRPELARITAAITVLYVIPANAPISLEEFETGVRVGFASAPRARFVKIDNSCHFIQIDQLERFVAEVEEFMR